MATPVVNKSDISLPYYSTTRPATSEAHINAEVMRILQLLFYGILGEAMAMFGMVTNIINIVCFAKQGFKESINISLLALAVSDFGCLLTMLWSGLCFVPMFQEADLAFDPLDVQYVVTGTPHLVFTRITSSITALITLERCLCVMMPLKVKSMFTPRIVTILNVCIFLVLIITFSPVFFTSKLGMMYVSARNRTILGLIPNENRAVIEQVSFAINSVIFPAIALLIILVCMSTMVLQLQKQSKWRQAHSGRTNVDATSEREEKLVKMIVMISTLFVVCFLPSIVILLLVSIEPEFNIGGKLVQWTMFAYGFSTFAESTNSSINILIYYKMSGRYRASFREVFTRQKQDIKSESKQGSKRI